MAANRSLGSLTVDLLLKAGGWSEGWSKAERDADRSQRKIAADAKRRAKEVEEAWEKSAATIGNVIGGLVGGITVGAGFQKFIAETVQAQKEQAGLAAALKATGNAAGFSLERLNAMAGQLEKTTGIAAGELNQAQKVLTGFTNIVGKEYSEALQMAADFSAYTGQSMTASAELMGRALNIPSVGMANLSKQGFKFTEDQINLAKSLEETGRVAEAQKIILDELETTYGGAAEAARDTLGGALSALKNTFNSLMTGEGGSIDGFKKAIEDMNTAMSDEKTRSAFQTLLTWMAELATMTIKLTANLITFIQTKDKIGAITGTDEFGRMTSSAKDAQKEVEQLTNELARMIEVQKERPGDDRLAKRIDAWRSKLLDAQTRAQGATGALKQFADGLKQPEIAPVVAPDLTPRNPGDVVLKTDKPSGGKSQVEKDLEAASKYIATLKEEVVVRKNMTAEQKLDYNLQEGKVKLSGQMLEQARQYAKAIDARKRATEEFSVYLKDQEDQAKAYVELSKAKEKLWASMAEQDIELENQARLLEQEYELIGASTRQRTIANETLKAQIELEKELRAISNDATLDGASKDEAEARARARYARKIALAERQAYVSEWEKTSGIIGQTLQDYIMGGGKNAADYLKRLFSTLVLQPVVQTAVSSLFGGGGGSGSGSIGGGSALTDWSKWGNTASGWASDASFKMVSNGWTEMGSSMMSLSKTITSVDSYLKTVPGMSGGIGSAAGYLGSIYSLTQGQYGSALGSAIGTYILPGIGTMIGSTLGGLLDGAFGHKSTQEYGGTALYSAALGAQTSTTHGAFGTGFGGVAANEQILANVSGISQSIVTALDATAKTFGKTVGYEAAAGFASDFGDEATWGGLRIALGGNDIVNWDNTRTSRWAPKEFASGEDGYKQYLDAVAVDVKTALLAMDLPGWADQIVSAATDMESINAALQQVGATRAVFDSLGKSMQMFSGISGELQTQLIAVSGSMDALSNNASAFYQGFFSEQERMDALNQQLRESLSGLGVGIDPSLGEHAKEQFRATVEAAMAGGQGELAAQLLALSGSFATAADYALKFSDDSVALLNEIMSQQHELWADLAEAEGDLATAAQRRYWIETAGMNQAEQAAYDYIAAIRAQVSATQAATASLASLSEQQWSLENQLLSMQGKTGEVADRTRAKELEALLEGVTDEDKRRQITAAYDYNVSLQKQVQAMQDAQSAASQMSSAVNDAARSMQSFVDSLASEVQRLRGLMETQAPGSFESLQARFAIASAQARAGDEDALAELPDISRAMEQAAQSSVATAEELAKFRSSTANSLQETMRLIAQAFGSSIKLPALSSGTNYVERSGLALLHEGEAVVPRAYNPCAGAVSNSDGVLAELVQIRTDMNALLTGNASINLRGVRVLERWNAEGIPETRPEGAL